MDTLPETLADALAALTKLNADYSALEALAADAGAQATEANQQRAAVQMAYESLSTARDIEVGALKAQIETLQATQADANAKAVEIVAAIGVEPVAVVTETQNPTAKQSLNERLEGVTDARKRGQIRSEYLNSLK